MLQYPKIELFEEMKQVRFIVSLYSLKRNTQLIRIMKALLIYEVIPEETKCFSFEVEENSPIHTLLEKTNGHTANVDDYIIESLYLQDALTNNESCWADEDHPFKGAIAKIADETSIPLAIPYDRVFMSAFYL